MPSPSTRWRHHSRAWQFTTSNSHDKVDQEVERVSADLDKFIAEVLKQHKILFGMHAIKTAE